MASTASSLPQRFDAWRKAHITDQVFYFLVAALIGLITGVCAFLLKWMISHVSRLLTANLSVDGGFNWLLLVIPVLGIVLTGVFQRNLLHANLTHGVSQLMHDFNIHRLKLPRYLTWASMAASTLTLGFGGSAGSEGPIAYTGAAVGSNVARIFGLDRRVLMVMVGCGAGAGIAGIFKAPIGGTLFTLEVLKLEFTTVSVMALLIACVLSAMTAYALSGFTVDLSYLQMEQFEPTTVVYIALLGVVCGFYSIYYSAVMKGMAHFYDSIKNGWIKNIVSGGLLSVILFLFPAMYGEGYAMMSDILNGRFDDMVRFSGILRGVSDVSVLLTLAGLIAVAKAFAASASNSGGGVAGDFAPTLFAGCFVGLFYSLALNTWFGLDLPVSAMAFMGMAGVMAGAIRAPFMALFLTAEMTNGFILFLPLLGVSAISYGIVRLFSGPDYYNEPRSLRLK